MPYFLFFALDLHHLRKGAIMLETKHLVNLKLANMLTIYILYLYSLVFSAEYKLFKSLINTSLKSQLWLAHTRHFSAHHITHAAHNFCHAAFGEHFHHFLRVFKLFKQTVHFLHLHAT